MSDQNAGVWSAGPTQFGTATAEEIDDAQALRRPSAHNARFQRRTTPQPTEEVVLDRNVLRAVSSDSKPQTQRRRELVGDLPDWEPLPPDELFLQRPGQK